MKKAVSIIQWISIAVLFVSMGIIGVRIFSGNYDFLTAGYAAVVSWAVFFACLIIRSFMNRCPYCGKIRIASGEYCSYCGKKIDG